MSKVTSRRGEDVDFELLRLKDQLNKIPKTIDVVQRERYIDMRRRRSGARKINEMLAEQAENQKYVKDRIDEQRKLRAESENKENNASEIQTLEEVKKEDTHVTASEESSQTKDQLDVPKRLDRKVR